MPVQKIHIENLKTLAGQYPVFDVRSPGEYSHAHIPGAYSLPLFTDDERKQVGTIYKQQSREAAIKTGLDFFGGKMRRLVEETENMVSGFLSNPGDNRQSRNIIVHCWRGGMRSAAVAWLLDLYGFNVYLLSGGYKAYRRWVLAQFEKDYRFAIIGGYTGSGKTLLLDGLKLNGKITIDLEGLACHKGSAFGAMEGIPQPRQEMFENLLSEALFNAVCHLHNTNGSTANNHQPPADIIYIEDESQRIGNLQIPMPLWYAMRKAPVFFIDIPFEQRLNYITGDYGKLKKERLTDAVLRIQKRLGGLDTKTCMQLLQEDKYSDAFAILLRYYDKYYLKGLYNRENISALLHKIPCSSVNTQINTQKILSCLQVNA
jgi:tRNA 2-selenouridine synthase